MNKNKTRTLKSMLLPTFCTQDQNPTVHNARLSTTYHLFTHVQSWLYHWHDACITWWSSFHYNTSVVITNRKMTQNRMWHVICRTVLSQIDIYHKWWIQYWSQLERGEVSCKSKWNVKITCECQMPQNLSCDWLMWFMKVISDVLLVSLTRAQGV